MALITGGARIGQVVAQALAARGCALALTYRDSRAAAEACAASARTAGVSTLVVHADATDEAQIRAAVQATAQLVPHGLPAANGPPVARSWRCTLPRKAQREH